MSKKHLHIRDGLVRAISFPDEVVGRYGEIVEVDASVKVGVGDVWPPKEAVTADAEAKPVKAKAK